MRYIWVTLIVLFNLRISHGQKYLTKSGTTEFKASVPAFEPVEAKSTSTTAILDVSNGEVAALIFVKSFHFRVALMEEHFNENYMDSHKYPKATLRGVISDLDITDLSSIPRSYDLSGSLNIKGVEQEFESPILLSKNDGRVIVTASFILRPGDFDIAIPSIVKDKISEEVQVTVAYEMVKKK